MKYHVFISIISFIVALMCAVIMLSPAVAGAEEPSIGLYSRCAVVIDIDIDSDIVTVVDSTDFVWQFTGVEDYILGDFVVMEMWEHETPDYILDDEIIWVSYSGFNVYYMDEYR